MTPENAQGITVRARKSAPENTLTPVTAPKWAWRNRRLLLRTAKHLWPNRAQVPWSVRIPLAVAAPFLAMPGIPDLGIDEAALAVAALVLWLRPGDRARSLAVLRQCWATAQAELERGEWCDWCSARQDSKQARAAKRKAARR